MISIILLNLILIPLTVCLAPALDQKSQYEYRAWVKYEIVRIAYEKEFARYAHDLGFKESSNNPDAINSIGCMGEFQYSYPTLKDLGYSHITPSAFRANPAIFPPVLQFKVLCAHIKVNEITLKDYMQFIGKTIQGVLITKSGILAAAHLGGCQGVKIFLLSDGSINYADKNNTSIRDYMTFFAGYNI